MLTGAITALVTPMLENGDVDFTSLKHLVNFQIENGIAGLVVTGTTGESALLNNDEKIKIIDQVIATAANRVKIIVGVSSASTKFACDYIAEHLNNIPGIDYILVLAPYYIKPTQEGIYQHFAHIAKVSNKPIILYNVPTRTSCDLHDETTLRLAHDYKNIVGLKDATGDITRCAYLVKNKPSDFCLYSGDDGTSLEFMLNGGDGVMSVVSNVIPKKFSQMCNFAINANRDESSSNGGRDQAIAINDAISELFSVLFIESNPIPIKWALFAISIISTANLRLPLTTLSIDKQTILKPILMRIIEKRVYAA